MLINYIYWSVIIISTPKPIISCMWMTPTDICFSSSQWTFLRRFTKEPPGSSNKKLDTDHVSAKIWVMVFSPTLLLNFSQKPSERGQQNYGGMRRWKVWWVPHLDNLFFNKIENQGIQNKSVFKHTNIHNGRILNLNSRGGKPVTINYEVRLLGPLQHYIVKWVSEV